MNVVKYHERLNELESDVRTKIIELLYEHQNFNFAEQLLETEGVEYNKEMAISPILDSYDLLEGLLQIEARNSFTGAVYDCYVAEISLRGVHLIKVECLSNEYNGKMDQILSTRDLINLLDEMYGFLTLKNK